MTRSASEWNFHFLLVSEVSATQIRQRSKVPLLANVFFFWLAATESVDNTGYMYLIPDQICHSPYCQSYNSYSVSLENLVLGQLIIPKLKFFFICITYLVDKLY